MEGLADAMVDRVLNAASTLVVELEVRVKQELVRQLLIGHATGKRRVHTSRCCCRREKSTARKTGFVEFGKSAGTCDLLQLGPEALDLGSELDLERGVIRLVGRQMLLGLIERYKGVLDAAGQLGLQTKRCQS